MCVYMFIYVYTCAYIYIYILYSLYLYHVIYNRYIIDMTAWEIRIYSFRISPASIYTHSSALAAPTDLNLSLQRLICREQNSSHSASCPLSA